MKKLVCLLSVALLLVYSVKAQESIGLFYDNYLPSSAMLKNPSAPVFSPFRWQVNVVSAGLFAENNLVFAKSESNMGFLHDWKSQQEPVISFTNLNKARAHFYSFIQGPSAFVQLKHFTVGVFTDEKYAGSLVSLRAPQNLSGLEKINYSQDYVIPEFKAGYLHWDEIGINLGTELNQNYGGHLGVGLNVKYLGAGDGFYLNNNQAFTINRDAIYTQQNLLDVNFGYTATAGGNQPGNPFNFNFSGRGFGADVGVIYTLDGNGENELYNWKFGASLTDIGMIYFSKQSSTYSFNRNTVFKEETTTLQQIGDLNTLANSGSGIVYDATEQAFTGTKYKMVLPGAISVTVEKSLTHGFYIGALAMQRVVLGKNAVKRPNTLAITPRFEKKWFAVAVPFVMYEQQRMYFGTSLRIGPVIIGSDNIMSWFIPSRYFGTDLYVGLHINPFNIHSGKGKNLNFRNPYHHHVECPRMK